MTPSRLPHLFATTLLLALPVAAGCRGVLGLSDLTFDGSTGGAGGAGASVTDQASSSGSGMATVTSTTSASTTSVSVGGGGGGGGGGGAGAGGGGGGTDGVCVISADCNPGRLCHAGLCRGAVAVAAGDAHSCAALDDGSVQCWGRAAEGRLGYSVTPVDQHLPVEVPDLSGVLRLSAGAGHTCTIEGNGVAHCWGSNDFGQLGNVSTADAYTPTGVTPVMAGGEAIAAGATSTCAVVSGGVSCWGNNVDGQLGDGTNVQRLNPVPVNSLGPGSGATAVCVGSSTQPGSGFACAVVGNAVRCWGANGSGQLGNMTMVGSLSPVSVTGLTGTTITGLACGDLHACAIKGNGSAECWGNNMHGAVGNGGTNGPYDTPQAVAGSGLFMAIDAGGETTCAVRQGGKPQCWGYNNVGQLGDGTMTQKAAPTDVGTLAHGTAIATSKFHSCAILDDGAVWCWGTNPFGQLGNGTASPTPTTPVPIGP